MNLFWKQSRWWGTVTSEGMLWNEERIRESTPAIVQPATVKPATVQPATVQPETV